MEPLFVNDTRMDYELFRDAMRMHHRHAKPVRRIVALCVAVACFALCASYIYVASYLAAAAFFAYGAAMGFVFLAGYRLYARRGYRNHQALHPSGVSMHFLCADRYAMETENGTTSFAYDRYTRVLLGERAVMLMVGNSYMILDRAGFRAGQEREALAFLRERCRHARFSP